MIYESCILLPGLYVFLNCEAGGEVTQVFSVFAAANIASCCTVHQGIFSMETSEKVLIPVLLSGVPVATNWDA